MSLVQPGIELQNGEEALGAQPFSPLEEGGAGTLGPGWIRRRVVRRQIFHPNNLMVGLAFLIILITLLWAVFPSIWSADTAIGTYPTQALLAPSGHFILGTDQYGRSVFAEIVYGARSAMEIGFFATLGSAVVGSLVGIIAGYSGGIVDMILMRCIDVLLALPGLFLALIFVAALSPTLPNLIIAVSISGIPAFARVLRGQSLQVRSRLYVDAAVVLGVPRWRIILRHVVPNCLAPVFVLGAIGFGFAIIIGASLAFLGLGPTTAPLNWGALISSGQGYINQEWWITTFPGLIITAVVISVNIIGDWVRDRMEPHSR